MARIAAAEWAMYVIPANAGIHPLPISTALDPGPVSSTGWHFRRDDSCSVVSAQPGGPQVRRGGEN